VDVLSVLKLSLFFYFCVLVVLLVAGTVLWNVAEAAGAIGKLDKLVRSLFALSSFQLHPLDALLWGGAIVAAWCLLGVLASVVAAVLYNLLSNVVGGVRVVVSGDEEA
jgi:Ni,Fe-hydrogenase I cytochrome b subunit